MEKYKEKLSNLKEEAKANFVPIVRDNTIDKLVCLLKENNCKDILEIGTAIGYSGIIMLMQDSQIKLTTIEKNEERFLKAKQNFSDLSLLGRTNLILGDAYQEILSLQNNENKFDLIFLDGPKGQYIKYLPILKKLLKEGGIIFADNILLGGLLKNENLVNHKNRTMVRNMKSFLNQIQKDIDFETEIYEIDDGFVIAKLKSTKDN